MLPPLLLFPLYCLIVFFMLLSKTSHNVRCFVWRHGFVFLFLSQN